MERASINYLKTWLSSTNRKPMVIRGARQVGKTWLVRHLAQVSGKKLIELNFERNMTYESLFSSNDPQAILLNISAALNQEVVIENSLLFLDEIQAVPRIFSKLRWFAEELPELPVIAAGSLLEFTLAEHTFSMPVGRVGYLHLEPLSFEEFLLAQNKHSLFEYLISYDFEIEIPIAIHEQFMLLFKEYLLVGGLPAVVSNWISERSLNQVNQIQHDLLTTYRDDFSKYKGKIAIERLDEVMMAIPKVLGKKFVFSHVNKTVQANTMKQVLNLLRKAKICNPVWACSANGVPLGAEIKEKYFKETFLDTGLCSVALGLNLNQINSVNEIILINNGGIAEQVAGQILRTINPGYIEPILYYWLREEKGSNAQVDYIIQNGNKVIPVEVKAGSAGSLKSLHLFMDSKKLKQAVRVNSDFPSQTKVQIKSHTGNNIEYQLLSIPFYLLGQLHRLLDLSHIV
ncbi:MAG: ATP-binding protein [Gammaproteobacteria bacterium]